MENSPNESSEPNQARDMPADRRVLSLEKVRYGVLHPWEIPGYVYKSTVRKWRQWRSDDWEEYYLRTTKRESEPEGLVGPADKFEEMRDWQFDLLLEQGLQPGDTVLDLGCGVLRGGIPLIEYLEPGNYYGTDISLKALLDGHRRIHENGLGPKEPTLIRNEDLSFEALAGLDADYLLAQSVWSHLPPNRLVECLSNMDKALSGEATVVATFNEIDDDRWEDIGHADRAGVDYGYSFEWLSEAVSESGYDLARVDETHPSGQSVVRLTPD